jgi:hypothetical protein
MRKCIQRGITIESLSVPEKYCRVCYAMLNAIIGRKWFQDGQMSFEAETLAGIACKSALLGDDGPREFRQ